MGREELREDPVDLSSVLSVGPRVFPEPVKVAAVGFGAHHGATAQSKVGLSPSLLAGHRAGVGEPVWGGL